MNCGIQIDECCTQSKNDLINQWTELPVAPECQGMVRGDWSYRGIWSLMKFVQR
jgi:hypothetical protein